MSHLVLARKYRPKTFSEVIGQDTVIATLKAALIKDRMAHALLFTGSRGIGKTTIARIVAKAMVCLQRKEADPCGECAQCQSIDNFSSLDVIEIDGASHTGVDDVRELRDSARYQPSSAKYRIFIIDEVHMLSTNAFNALLKIIEEPPAHVIFIFATTEAHKIPKTILSRCQRYDLRRIAIEDMVNILKPMLLLEGWEFEEEGLFLLAKLADGGLRDALSMTEQVLALGQKRYTAQNVAEALGVISHQAVKDLSDALIYAKVGSALTIIKEVYIKGIDLGSMMDAITEYFRLLALCAHIESFKEAQTLIPGLQEDDFMRAQSIDKGELKRLFAMALDNMAQVMSSRKPLLAIELFVLRAALRPAMSEALTINWCLQKLDALTQGKPLKKAPPAIQEPKREIKTPKAVKTSEDKEKLFFTLINELSLKQPGIATHLRHARAVIDGSLLKLHFELSLHFDKVKSHEHNNDLVALIKRFYGTATKLELILEKKPEHDIKTVKTLAENAVLEKNAQEQALREKAKNNPLVKKAIEIFGGDITKVERIERHEI